MISLIGIIYAYTHALGVGGRFVGFFKSILTFIILYNNLIPISLIVTLEVSCWL